MFQRSFSVLALAALVFTFAGFTSCSDMQRKEVCKTYERNGASTFGVADTFLSIIHNRPDLIKEACPWVSNSLTTTLSRIRDVAHDAANGYFGETKEVCLETVKELKCSNARVSRQNDDRCMQIDVCKKKDVIVLNKIDGYDEAVKLENLAKKAILYVNVPCENFDLNPKEAAEILARTMYEIKGPLKTVADQLYIRAHCGDFQGEEFKQ